MRCVYRENDVWSSKGLEIGLNSSIDEANIHCLTNHFSLFSSSIFVLPDLLNPIEEIHLFSTISNNMICLILVIVVFIIYFVILYWSSVQDKKDICMVRTLKTNLTLLFDCLLCFQSRIIVLDDNYTGEDEVYLVTVYTGHSLGSGTTANVCIELNGTICNSRVSIII